MADQFLTTNDVAYRLNVCQRTVTRMILRGELKARRVGNRWRIAPEDLNA